MKRFVLLFGLLCLGAPALRAQVVGIDDTFDTANPCGNGWECIGSVAWVPPDADPCPTDDPNFFNPWATFDPQYTPLLETGDPGEPKQRGGELYARIGEGTYVYTSYAWFRQLPAGVPGAYRLFANLISLGRQEGTR